MSTSIVLVRQDHRVPEKRDADAARRVLFGIVDGLTEADQRAWRATVNAWFRMEPGECSNIDVTVERFGPFHRRHMAMEQAIFNAQEVFEDFKAGFRDWLKIGAGFVDWDFGADGVMQCKPRSTSYDEMDDIAMREFHHCCIRFLASPRAMDYLWSHLSERARHEMMTGLLKGFRE